MLARFYAKLIQRPELIILTAVAILTRFWGILYPKAIVFDEIYFKEYAGAYLNGTYYFDPHPPLGKLLLGGFAHLLGLSGSAVAGTDPSVLLRILPALAGTLIIPVFYILLRQLKASRRVATLGALLLLLDNALLVESRFILLDSMLVLFGLSALTLYLAARRRSHAQRWIFLASSAFCAGLAASTKWTGLAALGIIGIIWVLDNITTVRSHWRRLISEAALLLLVPAAVYLSVFAIHFALLPKTGQGDAFMSSRFQSTLIGNPAYDPTVHMSFLDKFLDLNRAMHDSEISLQTATHPYGSPWYTWPTMQRPVYYWQGNTGADGRQGNIYLLGNPIVWWGTLLMLIALITAYTNRQKPFNQYRSGLLLLLIAYLSNFLPFIGIHRVMFLYHYFYALIFSLALGILGTGIIAGWMDHDDKFWKFPSRLSAFTYFAIAGLAILSFLYFAPLSYGWPLTPTGLQQHMWLPSWR